MVFVLLVVTVVVVSDLPGFSGLVVGLLGLRRAARGYRLLEEYQAARGARLIRGYRVGGRASLA